MSFEKDVKRSLPFKDASITYKTGYDGDKIPTAVNYKDADGTSHSVPVERSYDGGYRPKAGYTPDGDPAWPGKRNGYDP